MLSWLRRRAVALPARVPGCTRVIRRVRSRCVPIVMYHGVLAEPLPYTNWCQLSQQRFAEQIAFLAQHYRVLPLSEVINRLERDLPLPEKVAAVTFDDGFRSVYSTAAPILQRYAVPYTVFLVTNVVGSSTTVWPEYLLAALMNTPRKTVAFSGRDWPLAGVQQRLAAWHKISFELYQMQEERKQASLHLLMEALGPAEVANSPFAIMSWENVRELAAGGLADFGSHTHTHVILSRCTEQKQRDELQSSRDVLRERLGKAELFAYPNGLREDFTSLTKGLVKGLGYRCAVTTISGLNRRGADMYELRRVNVGADTGLNDFELLMLGL